MSYVNVKVKDVEVKLWCGACRCDAWVQCWVQRFNVEFCHFGSLKEAMWRGRHTQEAGSLAFSGGSWWNCLKFSWGNSSPQAHHLYRDSLHPIHAVCRHVNTQCLGERLVGSVKWHKDSDRHRTHHCNQSEHLDNCYVRRQSREATASADEAQQPDVTAFQFLLWRSSDQWRHQCLYSLNLDDTRVKLGFLRIWLSRLMTTMHFVHALRNYSQEGLHKSQGPCTFILCGR